jgi:tetratricopeptide (TPR) repeat protein
LWKALDYADAARFCNAHGAHATTIDACRVGLSLDPDNAMLYVYRACAYDEFGQLAEAVADCEAAIRLAPRGPAAVLALVTLALVRERLGDFAGALEAAQDAIAIEPADREAHAALGTLRAWHGDYRAAWPELECHWLDERMQFLQRFPGLAEWNGEPIDDRRLLLVHGQGLGDILHMLRYLPRVRERAAQVLLECPQSMLGLVRALAGNADVFVTGTTPRDRFDVFGRTMTLARLSGEDGTHGHSGVPYIVADDAHTNAWSSRFEPRAGRLRVGIVWAGNPEHPNDRRRSIPLDAFAPLARIAGTDWYSLQYGPHANDPAPNGLNLTRLGDAIADLSDTAAIVAQLDLVLTIDTAVAHLAGAMGVPVWLLLPWRPDWRWSPTAHDTPWYPTMRLFHAGEQSWPALLPEVADALRALIASKA